MSTGSDFVKWLRPAGCAVFLIFGIVFTVSLFTMKGAPVDGYEAPHRSAYYKQNLDELREEIVQNLLPLLDIGDVDVSFDGRVITVEGAQADLVAVRSALDHYYDDKFFEFVEAGL